MRLAHVKHVSMFVWNHDFSYEGTQVQVHANDFELSWVSKCGRENLLDCVCPHRRRIQTQALHLCDHDMQFFNIHGTIYMHMTMRDVCSSTFLEVPLGSVQSVRAAFCCVADAMGQKGS